MKYRIRLDAIIEPTDTVTRDQIKNLLIALKDRMQRMSAFETSSIAVEQCYHDENPPKPCQVEELFIK